MSYVVLARKYRPKSFETMTGQEHIVRTLTNAIAQGRVAHAYLFCGPRGVGKTTAARILARALNCEKGPTATPCGECQACRDIAAGTSVDVIEIDGASNNGVEDVRQIRDRVTYMPQRERHKIYIIDEVHMLTTQAFNALLKTLEEPPAHVKFIFATTEPQKLPDTILSRCQRHNFRRIPASAMAARLSEILQAEGAHMSDRAISLVVRQSDGGMRDALSMLDMILSAFGQNPSDDEVAEALGAIDRNAAQDICQAILNRDAASVISLVDALHCRGVDFRRLLEELALQFRHLLVARSITSPDARREALSELSDSEREAVVRMAQGADPMQIARLFDLLESGIGDVMRSQEPKLTAEIALLKCIHLAPSQTISQAIAHLDDVMRRAGPHLSAASLGAVRPPVGAGLPAAVLQPPPRTEHPFR